MLGIVGFLLVYVLNEVKRIDIHMRPSFVALFAFVFAVAGGAVWEIFEFTMDRLVGTTMQKPFLGDPSGLTDTMWDMIVDALGTAVISGFGGFRLSYRRRSRVEIAFRDAEVQDRECRLPARSQEALPQVGPDLSDHCHQIET